MAGAALPCRRNSSSGTAAEPWHTARRDHAGQFICQRSPGFRQAAPWYAWTDLWCQNHWRVSVDDP